MSHAEPRTQLVDLTDRLFELFLGPTFRPNGVFQMQLAYGPLDPGVPPVGLASLHAHTDAIQIVIQAPVPTLQCETLNRIAWRCASNPPEKRSSTARLSPAGWRNANGST
jgi:hypothetical protein